MAQHSSRRTEYVKIMEKAGGKDGIWVCPEYGREALRFTYRDGGIRLSHRLDFSGAMGDAWVTCLRETEKGTLWIGTDCGLFRHDLEKNATTRLKGIDGHVSGICEGTRGTIYCCTRGKGIYAVGKDGNPRAIYQNLPKGTYTFEVKATDGNGRWGEPVTALRIERTPAWYETCWAYVLYILLLCALTLGTVRYCLRRAQKRNDRLWAEAEELLNMRDYLTDKLDGQCEEAENLNRIFVERARQIVEHHLADPDMGVERLASEMNMSRSTFTRKIKSITGKTPSEFIRQIKMAYARRMVLAQDRSISEIATALGFSDRKHFTTSFKEEFGMPPTAYQKTHKDEA